MQTQTDGQAARSGFIDLEHLKSVTFSDQGFCVEILQVYQRQVRELVASLRKPNGSALEQENDLHRLKGASVGIGAFKLSQAIEIIPVGSEKLPDDLLAEVFDLTEKTLNEIEGLLERSL
ncbi:hypothetical protein [Polycladidibacter stylochi]|uniref:hypothetical protein n=1 Tax=Polycladidibacter stylochi TaxID=1807766 RepID=UPI000832608A|nr:hypothetical protein [Pseudovibrio stylochi]